MGDGGWRMENGEWRMENGEWRMENGEWRMENGGWRMEDGGWRMEEMYCFLSLGASLLPENKYAAIIISRRGPRTRISVESIF